MAFVKTLGGSLISIDCVREVCVSDDKQTVILSLEGGGEREVAWESWSQARSAETQAIIAAQPGTFILLIDEHGTRFGREPVIGWVVNTSGVTHPVTAAAALCDSKYPPLIQHPDGTIQDISGIYKSFDHWHEVLRADYALDVATVTAAKGRPN